VTRVTTRPEAGPTLLLVEDDDATRAAVRRDLVARGYRVDDVPDGSTALARWGARRPDVVLLDLGLPDLDGLTIIRRIRREATTPILVLSARGAEATKVEALELGADDYVTKPFSMPVSGRPCAGRPVRQRIRRGASSPARSWLTPPPTRLRSTVASSS
jgi:two-component system KDP operon response regulator KdpE